MDEYWFLQRLRGFGKLPVFIEGETAITYSGFVDLCNQQQAVMQTRGVVSGDLVAFPAEQKINTFITFFAVAAIGAIAYPFRDKSQLDLLKKNSAGFWRWQSGELIKDTGSGYEPKQFQKLTKKAHAGLVLSTSGTTGNPKLVLHDLDLLLEKYLKLRSRNTTVLVFQTDHVSGIETALSIISPGGAVVFAPEINPAIVCELIHKHAANILACSPTFLRLLLLGKVLNQYDLSTLQVINIGAERMPMNLYNQLKQALPQVALRQAYGTTETANIRTYAGENTGGMKLGEINRDYRIINNELFLKTPPSVIGYITPDKMPVKNGWYCTGDVVETLEDGYFRIVGRKGDIINTGGEKVSPLEVEEVLLKFPQVLDAYVHAESNLILGQMVVSEIVPVDKENLQLLKKNLTKHCRKFLPRHKIPVKFYFRDKVLLNSRLKKKV